jgi:hypothetical protein
MSTDFDKLVEILEKKKEKGSEEYHFRPYLVDGVLCYIVLYLKHSILTVESVNIKCKYNYEGIDFNQPYVLYYHKYKSFTSVLELIPKLVQNYKILNGDLESPTNYEELKLETCVLPYSEDEKCSICFEDTTDITLCNHYICFHCRDKCVTKKQNKCPICRCEDVLQYYNNTTQLFNNRDNACLHPIFILPDLEKDQYRDDSSDDEDEDEDEEANVPPEVDPPVEANVPPVVDPPVEVNVPPVVDPPVEVNVLPFVPRVIHIEYINVGPLIPVNEEIIIVNE